MLLAYIGIDVAVKSSFKEILMKKDSPFLKLEKKYGVTISQSLHPDKMVREIRAVKGDMNVGITVTEKEIYTEVGEKKFYQSLADQLESMIQKELGPNQGKSAMNPDFGSITWATKMGLYTQTAAYGISKISDNTVFEDVKYTYSGSNNLSDYASTTTSPYKGISRDKPSTPWEPSSMEELYAGPPKKVVNKEKANAKPEPLTEAEEKAFAAAVDYLKAVKSHKSYDKAKEKLEDAADKLQSKIDFDEINEITLKKIYSGISKAKPIDPNKPIQPNLIYLSKEKENKK